jgi:plasmid stability protein
MEEDRMATLNIKNLPDALYKKLQARARRQRRSVSQEVIHILTQATERPPAMSILALRGLGRELWNEIDAAAHVETERRAWD